MLNTESAAIILTFNLFSKAQLAQATKRIRKEITSLICYKSMCGLWGCLHIKMLWTLWTLRLYIRRHWDKSPDLAELCSLQGPGWEVQVVTLRNLPAPQSSTQQVNQNNILGLLLSSLHHQNQAQGQVKAHRIFLF